MLVSMDFCRTRLSPDEILGRTKCSVLPSFKVGPAKGYLAPTSCCPTRSDTDHSRFMKFWISTLLGSDLRRAEMNPFQPGPD